MGLGLSGSSGSSGLFGLSGLSGFLVGGGSMVGARVLVAVKVGVGDGVDVPAISVKAMLV